MHGNRGPGKSLTLLWDFLREVGKWGPAWRGVIFRNEYKHLADLLTTSRRFYGSIIPGARFYAGSDYKWVFPGGEELLFRAAKDSNDYPAYHGHQYPWLGFDELTNFVSLDFYEDMKTTNRSPVRGIPKRMRSATNPFGRGHNAVKRYFIDPVPDGVVNRETPGWERVAIRSTVWENRFIVENDPEYIAGLMAIKDPNKRAAWAFGSWDITSGGMFDDIWTRSIHVLKPFAIPASWRIDRGLDWGSTKPFAVLWFAQSDGSDAVLSDGSRLPTIRGDVFIIRELYGCTGEENVGVQWTSSKVAKHVKDIDATFALKVRPGPADTQIWAKDDEESIGLRMEREGVTWTEAYKASGSRVGGWELIRTRLEAAAQRPRENPGLFVFENCTDTIRTFPVLARDAENTDDVDTDLEDHIADVIRYRVMTRAHRTKQKGF